jgi:hypothetical protein
MRPQGVAAVDVDVPHLSVWRCVSEAAERTAQRDTGLSLTMTGHSFIVVITVVVR